MPADHRTLLAVPVTAADTDSARRQIHCARELRADILEFRLDLMGSADWRTLLAESSLPVIATARPADQGGKFTGSLQQRLALLEQVSARRPAFIDFEWPHFVSDSSARKLIGSLTSDSLDSDKPALILSHHDFERVPPDLDRIAAEMGQTPAAVIKIVCLARSIGDNLPLLDFAHRSSKPAIILAMGQAGRISRLLAAKLGTFLSFSCISPDQASAPGQISLEDMRSLYHWDKISPATRIYGVIGCPVAHSLSPAIHNAAFEEAGLDSLYLPLLVEPGYESFAAFMDGFLCRPWLDLAGLSVTIPHKENALRYLSEHAGRVDSLARQIGSLNTIVISPDGALAGYNTDLDGALDALTTGMGIQRCDLAGKEVAVLGAGGAARAVVAGLVHAHAEVRIYNRTAERAQRLAREFSASAVPLDQLAQTPARIIINTTSVGMHPDSRVSPFPVEALRPDMVVFDTVYNPQQTLLLSQAATAGARTIAGAEMFIRQAARQFQLWTEKPAPIQLMRNVLKTRLVCS